MEEYPADPPHAPHPLTGHVGQQSDPIDLWTPHIHIIRQGKDRFCRTLPLSLLPMVIYHVMSAWGAFDNIAYG